MATQPGGSVTSRAASETRSGPPGSSTAGGGTGNSSGGGGTSGSTQTGAKFRHGLLQLMIHTIDPLHDGKSVELPQCVLHKSSQKYAKICKKQLKILLTKSSVNVPAYRDIQAPQFPNPKLFPPLKRKISPKIK